MSSTKKTKPPPTPSPTPKPTIVGEFSIGGCTCEVINIHGSSEHFVDTKRMVAHGTSVGADMNREDGEFLLKHRDEIPPAYLGTTFVFPQWQSEKNTVNDGKIRTVDSRGVTWWCKQTFPNTWNWDSKCKMVRFSNLRLT